MVILFPVCIQVPARLFIIGIKKTSNKKGPLSEFLKKVFYLEHNFLLKTC